MKTLLFFAVMFGLALSADLSPVWAQDEAPQAAPMKQAPTPGKLEIQITSDDKTESFDHPGKAIRDLGRAISRAKRAKEGEEPAFEAVFTLNDQVFTFGDPEAALGAAKALITALRELPRLRMGLGDLDEIPELKLEDQQEQQQQPAANQKPKGQISRAAAIAEVRRRINVALQRQMFVPNTGGGVSLRIPSQAMMQQVVKQEVDKARREGLLPDNTTPAQLGKGLGTDPREARKDAIVQMLAAAFSHADSTGKAGEQAEKTDNAEQDKEAPNQP